MTRWLCDTSVAVPAVLTSHDAHQSVIHQLGRRRLGMPAHAALETYSVLTRLPGDARLAPRDAAMIIADRFGDPVTCSSELLAALVPELAALGVAGGAVYDALIAITAREASATLLTRDRRAASTYAVVTVPHVVLST